MDVHRSRFVPYPASAINALAFSSTNEFELGRGGYSNLRLAIGRANGDIEIWSPEKSVWVQETIFRAGKDRSVEALAWVQESDELDSTGKPTPGQLRLFSIGYSSTVTEWNLATGLPIRQSSGNHSEVWCMASQPRISIQTGKNKAPTEGEWRGQNIIAGCADGTLALLSTADSDLHFQKFVARSTAKKARALSIAWKDRDIVVAGFADSAIRIFDTRKSTLIRTVTLGAGPKGGPQEILVWAIKCLPNGDVVTGDSTGEIRFFDSQNHSQYQRIASHDADILDVASSADGSMVFSTGMDRKTTTYTKTVPAKRRWAQVAHKRNHEHDVKALASFDGVNLSVLVSGGLDTNLAITQIRDFWEAHPRVMSTLPQLPQVTSVTSGRLILTWWERELSIWKIKRQDPKALEEKVHKLVARIGLQGDENITSAAICSENNLLVVSTAAEVRLFEIRQKLGNDGPLKIRKIQLEQPLDGARLIQLSPDRRWLTLVTYTNQVEVVRIVMNSDTGKIRLLPKTIELERLDRYTTEHRRAVRPSALARYHRTITRVQFSPDSRVLVASDLAGYIDTWILQGHEDLTSPDVDEVVQLETHEDSNENKNEDDDEKEAITVFLGQYWTQNPSAGLLPKLTTAPLILSFRPLSQDTKHEPNGNPAVHPTRHNPHPISHDPPKGPYHLVVINVQHQIFEFDLLAGRLTEWSKRNPVLPEKFTATIQDRAMGCSWHMQGESERLWIYGNSWLSMFDLSQDFDVPAPKKDAGILESRNKRKRDDIFMPVGKRKKNEIIGFAPQIRTIEEGKVVRKKKDKATETPVLNGAGSADEEDDEEAGHGRSKRQEEEEDKQDTMLDAKKGPVKFWLTRIYRHVMGMVDIGATAECLEMVLIERPPDDLDLPPRFMPPHER